VRTDVEPLPAGAQQTAPQPPQTGTEAPPEPAIPGAQPPSAMPPLAQQGLTARPGDVGEQPAAPSAGGTAVEAATPEAIVTQAEDLGRQLRTLTDPEGPPAVWVPDGTQGLSSIAPDDHAAWAALVSGVPITDFDGQGGLLIAKDQSTARAALAARTQGESAQSIVARLEADPVHRQLVSEAKELQDPAHPRQALWLPKGRPDALNGNPFALTSFVQALGNTGVAIDDFDGRGGTLLARDQKIADAAKRARDQGQSAEEIIRSLTDATPGKTPLLAISSGQREPSAFEQASEEDWQDRGTQGHLREQGFERHDARRPRLREVPRSALAMDAEQLSKAVRDYEESLKDKTPAAIADAIEQKFGFPVDVAGLKRGDVWWRAADFSHRIYQPSSQKRWTGAGTAEGSGREALFWTESRLAEMERLWALPMTNAARAMHMTEATGQTITEQAIAHVVHRQRERFPDHLKQRLDDARDTHRLLSLPEVRDLSAREASTVLIEKFGRELSPAAINKARERMGLGRGNPVTVWTEAVNDELGKQIAAGKSNQQIAEHLSKFTGQTITRSAVGNQRIKRAARLRANLEAASKRDALAHPEDQKQLVEQGLIQPLKDGEGARLLRAGKRVLDAMRVGHPDAAVSGESARGEAGFMLAMGETVTIPDDVVDATHDALRPHLGIVPRGTRAGVLTAIEPVGEVVDLAGGKDRVRATFTDSSGKVFSLNLGWRHLSGARAFATLDGSLIGFVRFAAPPSGLDHSITSRQDITHLGELVHEVVHILRRRGVLTGAAWNRLLAHAKALEILDWSLRDYLEMVGNPAANKTEFYLTIRQAYEDLYKDSTDSDLTERLNQEAVAHLSELYVHGKIPAKDIAPVKDLLDALIFGHLSGPTAPRLTEASRAPSAANPIKERHVVKAAHQFLDATHRPKDREWINVVRQQFEDWRQRGGPITFDELNDLVDLVTPPEYDIRNVGLLEQAIDAIEAAGIGIEGFLSGSNEPDAALGARPPPSNSSPASGSPRTSAQAGSPVPDFSSYSIQPSPASNVPPWERFRSRP
jgi:hypothetical protein